MYLFYNQDPDSLLLIQENHRFPENYILRFCGKSKAKTLSTEIYEQNLFSRILQIIFLIFHLNKRDHFYEVCRFLISFT
jgi:hypothetical protein